jgi:hypothetical protein
MLSLIARSNPVAAGAAAIFLQMFYRLALTFPGLAAGPRETGTSDKELAARLTGQAQCRDDGAIVGEH